MPSVNANANANAQSKLWGYITGNDCVWGGGSRGGLFHEDMRFMNLIFMDCLRWGMSGYGGVREHILFLYMS